MTVDEDIHTLVPLPLHDDDQPAAAKKVSNDEIRIGPITRARAKLLEQQVNLILMESDYFTNENCLLPKSLHVCMIRFVGEEGMTRGSNELQHKEEQGVLITEECAREEREVGAQHLEKSKKNKS